MYGDGFSARSARYTSTGRARNGTVNRIAVTSRCAENSFTGTPHSVALQLDHYHKVGELETQRNDTRVLLSYRYSFGATSSRPAQLYRMVEQPRTVVEPGTFALNDSGASSASGLPSQSGATWRRIWPRSITRTRAGGT